MIHRVITSGLIIWCVVQQLMIWAVDDGYSQCNGAVKTLAGGMLENQRDVAQLAEYLEDVSRGLNQVIDVINTRGASNE